MQLSPSEIDLFYRLHWHLLLYFNQQESVVPEANTWETFVELPLEKKKKIRDRLYRKAEIIDSFVETNPFGFTPEELETIQQWRDFTRGSFFVMAYREEHTIFLQDGNPPKAYGVLALASTFEDLFGAARCLPQMIDAVLLPFQEKIVFDGLFDSYKIHFDKNYRRELVEKFDEAEEIFDIITILPIPRKEKDPEEKLRYYLRSKENRARYQSEIESMIKGNDRMAALYHRELGKAEARRHKRLLRDKDIHKGHFALLDGEIIAVGTTKSEVKGLVEEKIPEDKQNFVYFFYLDDRRKGKK